MSMVIDGYHIGVESDEALELIAEDRRLFVGESSLDETIARGNEYDLALSGLYEIHINRTRQAGMVPAFSLVELPDSNAQEIYDRICAAERMVASPDLTENGYLKGTAEVPDELFIANGSGALLSAEHATTQQAIKSATNLRFEKGPDWGVGGLGVVLQEDLGTGLVVARGMQTGNANGDDPHPLKDQLGSMIRDGDYNSFTSLHGMRRGNFDRPHEERAYDVFVGIGEPNFFKEAAAEIIRLIGSEYGLKVGINQGFTVMGPSADFRPKLKPDGSGYARDKFAASRPSNTRSYAEREFEAKGRPAWALQLELSSLLRLGPIDANPRIEDPKRAVMGVYTGYLLVSRYLETVSERL